MPFAGDLTSVAGLLRAACRNLSDGQQERQAADPETASKIDEFIQARFLPPLWCSSARAGRGGVPRPWCRH